MFTLLQYNESTEDDEEPSPDPGDYFPDSSAILSQNSRHQKGPNDVQFCHDAV
jgi:hypothetical protein